MGISIFHIPLIFAQVKIPVIVVLTKYDLLVVEHHRACSHISSPLEKMVEATKRAKNTFNEVTKELKRLNVPFAPVSTLKKTQKEYGGQLISSVTKSISF
jgi:GTPase